MAKPANWPYGFPKQIGDTVVHIRDSILAWIEQETATRSLREWAIAAKVEPSTLQKFVYQDPSHMLPMAVIGKLASVSGTFPELNKKELMDIPFFEIEGNKLVRKGLQKTTKSAGPNAFAVPVMWDMMNQRGFFVDDVVVVDPDRKPKKGDVVLVKTRSKIAIYEYNEPYLMAKSSTQHANLDIGLVDILGTVTEKHSFY